MVHLKGAHVKQKPSPKSVPSVENVIVPAVRPALSLHDMIKLASEIGASYLSNISIAPDSNQPGAVAVRAVPSNDYGYSSRNGESLRFYVRPGQTFEEAYRDYIVEVARDKLKEIAEKNRAIGAQANALNLAISTLMSNVRG